MGYDMRYGYEKDSMKGGLRIRAGGLNELSL